MTGSGIGWLQGTTRAAEHGFVLALLAAAFGTEPEACAGGTRWYSKSAGVGPHGLIAWAPRSRPDLMETYFEVRQSGLDELGGEGSLHLLDSLVDAGARFTRVDGYYDDTARHVEPPEVARAFRDGQRVTRLRQVREMRSWRVGAGGEAQDAGATTYLGSKSSEAMVRVYDKGAESGGSRPGVRWEVQMRGPRAQAFARGLLGAGGGLGGYVVGCIRGLVDFRERDGAEHGDRAPFVPWWAAIVGDAERVRLSAPAKVDSLARRAAWVDRQAAPTLAMLAIAHGPALLYELLACGEARLTEAQLRLAHRTAASD